jgi:hypothetical protein
MKYFWYYRPNENFPPPTIRLPEERRGGDRLAIACTQTKFSAKQQPALVSRWCEELPKLDGVRFLWLNSRVPQVMFDAACQVPNLEGLWVKWTAGKSIASLSHSHTLRYLHLGNCSGVASLAPLGDLTSLAWLGIEHFPKIDTIDPLASLTQLIGLTVQGSMLTTQRIRSIEPLRMMRDLRYLSLANVRVDDNSLDPLSGMKDLETLILPKWWDPSAVKSIRNANPKLIS